MLFIANAAMGIAAVSASVDSNAADIRMEMKVGLLTLEARNAPLYEVVQKVGELAGFKTILVVDFDEPQRVTASFEDVPVVEAVTRLVDDTNRIIFYTTSENSIEEPIISQVWLLGSSNSTTEPVASERESIILDDGLEHDEGKTRSESVLRLSTQAVPGLATKDAQEHVRNKLIHILQTDQDALVRSRAAIALGALRDEKAVLALESALLDEHSSVRSQAINALGQIADDRAANALGNILLYGKSKIERVMAAQALWKQDSEIARDYLRIGANDGDEQVRLASSKAPATPVKRPTVEQLGSEETQ